MGTKEMDERVNLPEILIETLRKGYVYTSKNEKVPLCGNVSLEDAETLYHVVMRLKPKRTLEIGFGQGISTLAIIQALEDIGDGEHHVVEPSEFNMGDIGMTLIERAGFENRFVFHSTLPELIVPTLPAIEFVFIDASHLFDKTIVAFVLSDSKLEIGGVIGFHDLWLPSQQQVLRYILTNRHYVPYEPVALTHRAPGLLLRIIRGLPKVKDLIHPNVLHPWRFFRLGNTAFIEKTSWDDRNWQYHVPF